MIVSFILFILLICSIVVGLVALNFEYFLESPLLKKEGSLKEIGAKKGDTVRWVYSGILKEPRDEIFTVEADYHILGLSDRLDHKFRIVSRSSRY